LFLSNPLLGETKGFKTREPIYELLGQEVVPENELHIEALVNGEDRIRNAFRRDPERTSWLM
jgi:hypothetical protein